MSARSPSPQLGAHPLEDGRCQFLVWAPHARRVEVVLPAQGRSQELRADSHGYHAETLEGVPAGTRYQLRLDGGEPLPDPASRFQPEGVHGPSEVVDPRPFPWTDGNWRGTPLRELVLYELHVGTYTREGTFDALVPHLPGLRELGITAIELMPICQFPGGRNWGYDGVFPFSVQSTYGGPEGLRRLVDACHAQGLAVLLDVVYNHLGPEGNVFHRFGPYFTDAYRTPWGEAFNFDGPHSGEVRRFFIESALSWMSDYHLDGLRLDAIHAILDRSARTFLEELAEACHMRAERLRRTFLVTAESDRNDPRDVLPTEAGGIGLDAIWNDDFHHALHSVLTGEREGYYADFGALDQLARAYRHGFVLAGDHSVHRQRPHGRSSRAVPAVHFIVASQNHDQVGNRARGERLSTLVPFEALKVAAAATLFSPYLPLIFMGEEHGELAPFQYFVSHQDPELVEAVRKGRRAEFEAFAWEGEVPDPQDARTFEASKLDHDLAREGRHRALRELYVELLRLRREEHALRKPSKERLQPERVGERGLRILRWYHEAHCCLVINFGPEPIEASLPLAAGGWVRLLDSQDVRWGGPGATQPERLQSDGLAARVQLEGWSFAMFGGPEEEGPEHG